MSFGENGLNDSRKTLLQHCRGLNRYKETNQNPEIIIQKLTCIVPHDKHRGT